MAISVPRLPFGPGRAIRCRKPADHHGHNHGYTKCMQHHLVGTLRPEARPDQGSRCLYPWPTLHVCIFFHAVPFHGLSRPFIVTSRSRSHLPHPHTFRAMVTNSFYLHRSWRASLAVRQPSMLQSRHMYPTAPLTVHALKYFRASWACPMLAFRSVRLSARSSSSTRSPKSSLLVVTTIESIP